MDDYGKMRASGIKWKKRIRSKDVQFDEIYMDFFNKVFRYVYNRTGNNKDAEDITSQIFLTILECLPEYKDNGHLAAWIFTIARNKIADHYRKKKQFSEFDENDFVTTDEKMLLSVIHKEHMETLFRLLESLPENEKELIRLRILGELKFTEIAKILKRSETSVKKAYYRLIQRIKDRMEVTND